MTDNYIKTGKIATASTMRVHSLSEGQKPLQLRNVTIIRSEEYFTQFPRQLALYTTSCYYFCAVGKYRQLLA